MFRYAEMPSMTDFSLLFNSPLYSPESDVFWDKAQLPVDVQPGTKTLIVVAGDNNDSTEEDQLNKIIEACKLNGKEYHVLHISIDKKIAWHHLKEIFKPEVVLLFGVQLHALGISAILHLNTINNFSGVKWVPTLSLTDLQKNSEAKKSLWINALKPLFADGE